MKIKIHNIVFVGILFIFSCNQDDDIVLQADEIELSSCNTFLDNYIVTSSSGVYRAPSQRDVFFPTDKIGYSVGNGGSIIKTIDGGSSWNALEQFYVPDVGIDPNALTWAIFRTVYFIDDQVGYAAGEGEESLLAQTDTEAVLVLTEDGGASWKKRYVDGTETVYDVIFENKNLGIGLFGIKDSDGQKLRKLTKTENGGEDWSIVDIPLKNITTNKFILSETKIFIYGKDENDELVLISSNDNGKTWQVVSKPNRHLTNLYFIDDDHAMTDYERSEDGGRTWQASDVEMGYASLIHFFSQKEGFIISPQFNNEHLATITHHNIYQTVDGGKSWEKSELSIDCNPLGYCHSPSKNLFFTIGGGKSNNFVRN